MIDSDMKDTINQWFKCRSDIDNFKLSQQLLLYVDSIRTLYSNKLLFKRIVK